MRRKQGRVRISARLKEKQATTSDCPGSAGSHEGSSQKVTELHCFPKRHKAKRTEITPILTTDDKKTMLDEPTSVANGDGKDSGDRTLDLVEGLCCEQTSWTRPSDVGMEESLEMGQCLPDEWPEREEGAATTRNGQGDNSAFIDEDSNEIMPVGQFFGNIELVQDYPPRVPLDSRVSRREYRRLHFIARNDSDEDDDSLGVEQRDGSRQRRKNRKNGLF